jgi:zinc protease
MPNMKNLLTLAWILFATLGFAQQTYNLNERVPDDPKVSKGLLPNGLTYYVRANSTPKNRADLYLVVHAGSVEEDDDQQGLAHFCEHMAFNGTKNFPKHELVSYLESIGMEFGPEINAYTDFDETVYTIKVPLDSAQFIEKGLQVLYDWSCQVTDSDEEIEKERGVIHEEWRSGRDADERMMQKWWPVFFYKSKYAERLPIGKMEIVDHCNPELIRKFRHDWYRPDLEAVIVVGDFDQAEMVKKVVEMFSQIPRRVDERKENTYPIPDHPETLISVQTDKEAQYSVAQVYYKHPLEVVKTLGDYRKGLVESLYNAMINERLSELTQKENPPFIYASSSYSELFGPASVYSSVAVCANGKIGEGLKAVLKENERVLKYGFTSGELERQKTVMMAAMEVAYNERDKQKSGTLADEYKRNFTQTKEPFPGIENEYNYFKAFVPGIKLDEVNALASKWITRDNRVVIVTAPESPNVKVPTEAEVSQFLADAEKEPVEPYQDEMADQPLLPLEPQPGKITKIHKIYPVDAEEWTLSNGARVIVKPTDFKDDEILFTAYSLGGSSLYGPTDDVSAELAPSVMKLSGLGKFDKISLDKQLAGKSVSVSPFLGELTAGLNGGSSVKDVETLFKLIYMNFTQQRTDQAAFNSFMVRARASLQNNKTSPEAAFQDTLQVVSTNYSPRKRPMTEETLKEANFERINQINQEQFHDAGNFIFFFVGNIDQGKLKLLVEKYLASLPSSKSHETWKDMGIREPSGVVERTVYKGQDVKGMQYLVFHGDFDYNRRNLLLINAVGKILTTRLIDVIREDKSSVYYIEANPSVDRFPVQKYDIAIYYGADPEKLGSLKEAVFQQIKDLAANGPTASDLEKAKEKLLREHETNLRENNYWLSILSNTYMNYHADFSQFNNFNDLVKAMTVDELKAAFRNWFNFNQYYGVELKPDADAEK